MNVTFFDIQDEANRLNGAVIEDTERLSQLLQGLRGRAPFICEIVAENGFELVVGVGEVGCAQYGRRDGSAGYVVALAPGREHVEGDTEFLAGGTATPISNRFCMPFSSVLEIVGHFHETSRAHPAFTWVAPFD
jgi:hypothetical protein